MTPDPQLGFKGSLRQSMAWLHTWVGLLLSVVLYFMFITGTTGYVHHEISRWMQPEEPRYEAAELPPAAEIAQRGIDTLVSKMPEAKAYYLTLPNPREGAILYAYAEPRGDGEAVDLRLDPATGQERIPVRASGGGATLYAMHYSLHYIPYEIAIYIVGMATMFMLLAIITGLVIHRKIFADFFTFRPAKGQRSWLDAHNLSSVIALPFMVVITYSGLLFYTFEYAPAVKWAAYGTSEQAAKQLDAEVYPDYAAPKPSGKPAALAPIGPMVAKAEQLWGEGRVQYLNIQNPGDTNALVTLEAAMSPTAIGKRQLLKFNGVTGRPADDANAQPLTSVAFADVLLAIHEGHFAGPLIRWVFLLSGLCGAAMVASGMVLWTSKRRQRMRDDEIATKGLLFVERMNVGVIVGLPIGIAVYFLANRILPLDVPGRAEWEMHLLFIAWAIALAHAAVRPRQNVWRERLGVAGLLFLCIPMVNALTSDVHLGRTLGWLGDQPDGTLAAFDLIMLGLGASFFFTRSRLKTKHHQKRPVSMQLEPAE